MRSIECEYDGQVFETTRADARFCSASCRARASKARKAAAGNAVPDEGSAEPAVIPQPGDLARRVSDLEDDVDLLERRSETTPDDAKVRKLVQDEVNGALGTVVARVQRLEQLAARLQCTLDAVSRPTRPPRGPVVDTERLDELEGAVITLANRISAVRDDLAEITGALRGLDPQ